MKRFGIANSVLAALGAVLFVILLLFYLDLEITPQGFSIRRAIKNAGGLAAVNAQAQKIFDRLGGSNEVLLISEMSDAPLLRQLGNSAVAFGENGYEPARIQIRRGGHEATYFFFILDPRKPTPERLPHGLQKLMDNIYVIR